MLYIINKINYISIIIKNNKNLRIWGINIGLSTFYHTRIFKKQLLFTTIIFSFSFNTLTNCKVHTFRKKDNPPYKRISI